MRKPRLTLEVTTVPSFHPFGVMREVHRFVVTPTVTNTLRAEASRATRLPRDRRRVVPANNRLLVGG